MANDFFDLEERGGAKHRHRNTHSKQDRPSSKSPNVNSSFNPNYETSRARTSNVENKFNFYDISKSSKNEQRMIRAGRAEKDYTESYDTSNNSTKFDLELYKPRENLSKKTNDLLLIKSDEANIRKSHDLSSDTPKLYKTDLNKKNIAQASLRLHKLPGADVDISRTLYGEKLHKSENASSPKLIKVSNYETTVSDTSNKKYKSKMSGSLFISLLVIFLFFVTLLYLLYRQSKVMQVNYYNAGLQYDIEKIDKENSERMERLSRNIDWEKLRRDAEGLGFRVPINKQIIELKQEDKDEVVFYDNQSNASGVINSRVDMNSIYDALEKYILDSERAENFPAEKSQESEKNTLGGENIE